MLEKVGLPPKPALKGNEWVVDASHCQGCASAFSFFNRKHHCRRCGGIFCGNCTQQRMNLRGQGEGPVRICDACKKLEDAARFESRYGHRNKTAKGGSRTGSYVQADLLLKDLFSSGPSPQISGTTDFLNDNDSVSHSLQGDEYASVDGEKIHSRSMSLGLERVAYEDERNSLVTPEILLQQAQEEKRQWIALKREGRAEDALQAFKRGRELEREAERLKLSLRRSQRKATSSARVSMEQQEEHSGSDRKRATHSSTSVLEGQGVPVDNGIDPIKAKRGREEHEENDDLMSALKDLGWSNADLQDAGRKQSKARSVEGELKELAASVRPVESSASQGGTSSMQVLAHKRRALALKREGKLAEAKEELKKAKIIERQIEEQEMGDGEESDDDLAALIRGLDKESTTESVDAISLDLASYSGMVDFGHDDDDEETEVTDSDINDPEMVAALRSMGWEEEAAAMEKSTLASGKHVFGDAASASKQQWKTHTGSSGGTKLQGSVGTGLDSLEIAQASLDDNMEAVHVTDEDMEDPYYLSALKAMGFAEDDAGKLMQPIISSIPKTSEKRNLQQEILFLKKEALVLKRAGKIQEAREELRQAKQLEKELEGLQLQHNKGGDVLAAFAGQEPEGGVPSEDIAHLIGEEVDLENVEVTEADMGDPDLAEALKSFGWKGVSSTEDSIYAEKKVEAVGPKFTGKFPEVAGASHHSKTRSELQKELLGLKRSALKLKREGRLEQAEDELKKAGVLEKKMEELNTSAVIPMKVPDTRYEISQGFANSEKEEEVTEDDMKDPKMLADLAGFGWIESEKDNEPVSRADTDALMKGMSQAIDHTTSVFGEANDKDSESKIEVAIPSNESMLVDGFKPDHVAYIQPYPAGKERKNSRAKADAPYPSIVKDLLTGDAWGSIQAQNIGSADVEDASDMIRTLPTPEEKFERRKTTVSNVDVDNPKMPERKPREEDSIPVSKEPVKAGIQMSKGFSEAPSDSLRYCAESVDSSTGTLSVETLQQEILAYKRKALALKREGRQAEAKEQLREAKMLEKKLAMQRSQSESPIMEGLSSRMPEQSGILSRSESETASSVVSATPKIVSSQQADRASRTDAGSRDNLSSVTSTGTSAAAAQKYNTGKDRLKLQRESLAHKRKALALRREGRMEEAETEFEVAKVLEKQMEELGGGESGHQEKDDSVSVDDLFDPQLLAALTGLGWKETDIVGQTAKGTPEVQVKLPKGDSRKTDVTPVTKSQQNEGRQQLEEKIKLEKVRAVQLKRSGRQSEALEVLRGAKQLERHLQSMYQ